MTISELRENRFFVIFNALLKGIKIKYNSGYYISLVNNKVYLSKYNENFEEYQTKESPELTLQSLLDFCNNIEDSDIKKIYSFSKLKDFQSKILQRNEI